MLGDSAALGAGGGGNGGEGGGASGDAVPPVPAVPHDVVSAATTGGGAGAGTGGGGGGVGSNSGDDERGRIDEGERSFGGNRWPRQETLALLSIRSDMDAAFRDASVKGPLWEEVSRKMAELGYNRSSKKCKEKFENVYKYHKRTKEGRSGKQDGKTYRFFDQLEALDQNYSPTPHSPNPSPKPPTTTNASSMSSLPIPTPTVSIPIQTAATTTVPMQQILSNTTLSSVPHITVPSTSPLPITIAQPILTTPSINLTIPPSNPTNFPTLNPTSFPTDDVFSDSSSSSTSSDETLEGRRKKKRKWKDFFERLMKEVIEKQEELQKTFLQAIEKREHDRMVREEAWRGQEMQRINREREILAQERSIAASKDAAIMSFLQKIAEQQNLGQVFSDINLVQPQSQPQPPQQSQPQQPTAVPHTVVQQPPPVIVTHQPVVVPAVQQPQPVVTNMEIVKADNNNNNNNGENFMAPSSSRWPKVEVQALIKLRTSLDNKYQENGPKGPLWEEISASMRKLGYNRNAKRCKEKWENINKYFKKVKESNKRRPEDSKTCPYFHQLDALYRQKQKTEGPKPDTTVAPLMVQPEQQWPPQQQDRDIPMEDVDNDDDEFEEEREGEEEEDDEEDEGGGGGNNYEIVANKATSAASVNASVGASAE